MAPEMSNEPQAGILAQAQHYWRVILKWKWTAALFFLAAVAIATIYSLSLTPMFTASGTVWIEDNPNILPFEDVQTFNGGSNLQSQARLLRSRSLASDVIDKLKLYDNPLFAETPKEGQSRPDPADARWRAREPSLHEGVGQADRLEDLGALVAADGRDAHLGHHLQQAFPDGRDVVLEGRLEGE